MGITGSTKGEFGFDVRQGYALHGMVLILAPNYTMIVSLNWFR
jgi:hypothetical protein